MKKAFWILVAVLCVSIAINVWQCSHKPEEYVVIKRDTVWKDSIIREPAPAESKETGETIYVKVPNNGDGSSCLNQHSTSDTIKQEEPSPLFVALPVEQKRYEDSLYTAWVSGYEPALDSIDLRLPTITETVTKTIVKPSPLITFGVQIGGGYGVFYRQPDVYIGVGGQINLWRK